MGAHRAGSSGAFWGTSGLGIVGDYPGRPMTCFRAEGIVDGVPMSDTAPATHNRGDGMKIQFWMAALLALSLFAAEASAQSFNDYPPGYPFGSPGTPMHPNGYDGYPGDTPPGTHGAPVGTPPQGGPGGTGFGVGNGGKGGDGAPGGIDGDGAGGLGGPGGDSGDSGGMGGQGGVGGAGDNDVFHGDDGGGGGRGGDGVDGGGAGGAGGEGGDGLFTGGDGGKGGEGGFKQGTNRRADAGATGKDGDALLGDLIEGLRQLLNAIRSLKEFQALL